MAKIENNVQRGTIKQTEKVNLKTGEVIEKPDTLIRKFIEVKMPNGKIRRRVTLDYATNGIPMVDLTGHEMTDPNYLVEKYSPNELVNYMIAKRSQGRPLIEGYDLTQEPERQDALQEVARLNNLFSQLDDDVQSKYKNVTKLLKALDDPKQRDQLLKFGLITEKNMDELQGKESTTTTTTTEEKKEETPKT